MITMHQAPVPGTRSGRGPKFRATTVINGRTYAADSRHGAPNELARVLIAADVPDQSVQVTHEGLRGHLSWSSLHAMAKWTYIEGSGSVRKVLWRGEKRGDSVSDDQG